MSLLTQFYNCGGGAGTGLQGIAYTFTGAWVGGNPGGAAHTHGLGITPGQMIMYGCSILNPLFSFNPTSRTHIQFPGTIMNGSVVGFSRDYRVPEKITFAANTITMQIDIGNPLNAWGGEGIWSGSY